MVLFPLALVANALVPTEHMPAVVRFIADWNPVSAVTAAARRLWANPNPADSIHAWPMQHPVVASRWRTLSHGWIDASIAPNAPTPGRDGSSDSSPCSPRARGSVRSEAALVTDRSSRRSDYRATAGQVTTAACRDAQASTRVSDTALEEGEST